MIEMLGNSPQVLHTVNRQNLTKVGGKNLEEIIIERGIVTVFKALVRNTNSVVYEVGFFSLIESFYKIQLILILEFDCKIFGFSIENNV